MSGKSLDFISRQLRGFEQECNIGVIYRLDSGGGVWRVEPGLYSHL